MHDQRPESKLYPRLFAHQDQQKISARFHYAGCFSECLSDALAIEVIDRICADDGIECGWFEGELAHVSGCDRGTLCDTRRLQVLKKSLLRTFSGAEVVFKRIAEKIQRDKSRLRASFEHHN